MGRVRTKTTKRAARALVESYYSKLTLDFTINKKLVEESAVISTKRVRNKIAGYVTQLMKRIQRGPVRGVSLKLQEDEREKRMEYVPEVSEFDTSRILVDPSTKAMLDTLGLSQGALGSNLQVSAGAYVAGYRK